jgi:formate dehydrogenase
LYYVLIGSLVLYPGGEAARNNPNLLGCVGNALGLRDFLERMGHELVVLTEKESELDTPS